MDTDTRDDKGNDEEMDTDTSIDADMEDGNGSRSQSTEGKEEMTCEKCGSKMKIKGNKWKCEYCQHEVKL